MIELRTQGALELTSADGRPFSSVLAQPRRTALLCYLALAVPRGFHRRDTLLALFWPDDDAEQGRHALRQSVYFLRRALGPNAIVSRGDEELGLEPDRIHCDAWLFEAAVDQGRPAEALALFRGELLAGFHISDAPDFERWLDQERDRLRKRAGEAAWALAAMREQEGDTAGAVGAGRRALAFSPTDETALRRLMLLMERLGDRSAAVRAYDSFAWKLEEEFELEPSGETRNLVARIRAESSSVVASEPRPDSTLDDTADRQVPRLKKAAGKHRVLALLVTIVLLLGGGWAIRAQLRRPSATGEAIGPPHSIAVLPFRNLRGDSSGDYFSDGITEEILHALVQIPGLQVAARTSAFQFKGQTIDAREAGRRLGVASILEGSIQRDGNNVRITARLTDTRTGYQIWSARFDRHLSDLFAVEDEISQALADRLKVPLGLVPRPLPGAVPIEAHDLYLRGLSLLALRGPALRQTIVYFESAIAIDSTFAAAWAGLAAAHELLPAYGLSSYKEELPRAEQAARRAIALDSMLGPAYAVLGSVYRDQMRWADSEQAYARALLLAPNDAEAIEQYGQFLFWTGQAADAIPWMDRARKLDPLAPIPATTIGTAHLFLHHYDSAATLLRHASELAPALHLPWMWRMWTELAARRYDLAEQAGRRLAQVSGVDPDIYSGLIRGVADSGQRRQALALLAGTPTSAPWALNHEYRVNWLTLLGDTASALDAVERLGSAPTPNGILTLWNPALDPIREHPRFRAVLQGLQLPFKSVGR
jgi:TolB-like protein/DNA-binding SARP family transcriptional activator/Flp pilus assembly protein TadD